MTPLPSDSIIISIPHCKACHQITQQNPHIKHIIIDSRSDSLEMLEVKKKLAKLRIAGYPAVVDKDLTKVLCYPAPLPNKEIQ